MKVDQLCTSNLMLRAMLIYVPDFPKPNATTLRLFGAPNIFAEANERVEPDGARVVRNDP